MKLAILTTITILWMAMIFSFSNQKSVASTNISDSFIDKTVIKIYSLFDDDFNDREIKQIFSRPIRKVAHFLVYFILGLLVMLTFKAYKLKNYIIFSVLFCFLYAISDEVHQLFVIGRSGEIIDVILDVLSSSLAIILFKVSKERKQILK